MFRPVFRAPFWVFLLFVALVLSLFRPARELMGRDLGKFARLWNGEVPRSNYDIYGDPLSSSNFSRAAFPPARRVNFGGMQVLPVFEPLLKQHQSDPELWLWAAAAFANRSELHNNADFERLRAKNLEVVAARFPNNPTVLATLWNFSAGAFSQFGPLDTRPPGPSSNVHTHWSPMISGPRPPGESAPRSYSIINQRQWAKPLPDAYKSELALIKRAQKIEPDNAFWWGCELLCLLGSRRDDETWAVLREGAQKTTWNDHGLEAALWGLRARQKYALSREIIDEKEAFHSFFPFEVYARQRECARQVKDNCAGLHLQGQHQKALRGALDFGKLGQLQAEQARTKIGSLVGNALTAIALTAGPLSFSTPKPFVPTKVQSPNKARARYIGNTASQLRFWKLAREADALDRRFLQSRAALWNSSDLNPVTTWGVWLGAARFLILAPIPLCVILLLLVGIFRRIRPLRALLRADEPWAPSKKIRVGWLGWPLLGIGGVLGVSLATALFGSQLLPQAQPTATFWQLLAEAGFSVNDLLSLDLLWLWFWGFAPALLVLVAWWRAHFDEQNARGVGLGARLRRILQPSEDGLVPLDLSPLFVLAVVSTCVFIVLGGALAFVVVPVIQPPSLNPTTWEDYGVMVFGALFLVSWMPPIWVRKRAANWRALFRGWAWHLRPLLRAQIVVSLVLWLLLMVSQSFLLPVAQADFARYYALGERRAGAKK